MNTYELNCISYWHPKLVAASVPTPQTEIIQLGDNWYDLIALMDPKPKKPEPPQTDNPLFKKIPIPDIPIRSYEEQLADWHKGEALMKSLAARLSFAAGHLGEPSFFLRSGLCSGKHNWNKTCNVQDLRNLRKHIWSIVEFHCLYDVGPWNTWAVRKWLKPETWMSDAISGMPINTELRVFCHEGKLNCLHHYWPMEAFRTMRSIHGTILSHDQVNSIAKIMYEHSKCIESEAIALAQEAAAALTDHPSWSIDILKDEEQGLFVTDVAVAAQSYHWPDCEKDIWR